MKALAVLFLLLIAPFCQGLSPPSTTPRTESFAVPLITERPSPQTILGTLNQLWNDPRPVTSLIGDAVSTNKEEEEENDSTKIPYCLLSEEFTVDQKHQFRILLYPRGRYASSSNSASQNNNAGPAAAYLRYIPQQYGDEVDVAWKLRLVDTSTSTENTLHVMTSGGLPRSNTTWSAAMTFCSEREDLESVGRATDWGSSTWYAQEVCEALRNGQLQAQGEMTIYDGRTGESSFSVPPKGAVKAVLQSATNAGDPTQDRSFRVGEVIVPMKSAKNDDDEPQSQKLLAESFVTPGTDYRIMTMATKDGTPIFSTDDVSVEERKDVQLALRPTGWKLQQQMWQQRGMKSIEWPVQVPAGLLSPTALTRFNFAAFWPRVAATFQRDQTAVLLGVALALSPLAAALIGRNFVSLYAIPSASMDPTLLKGDVLLVEKLPGVLDRTQRGDVVLFRPPNALTEIIGRSAISGNSLFVKRIVGMPGDKNIVLDPNTKEVTVEGQPSVGPNRNLCDDEPLRLIDRLLETGKGKNVEELGDDDVYVVGDCKAVSVDSRVFGVLPKQNIEGKPVGRIWPPSRVTFGPL